MKTSFSNMYWFGGFNEKLLKIKKKKCITSNITIFQKQISCYYFGIITITETRAVDS